MSSLLFSLVVALVVLSLAASEPYQMSIQANGKNIPISFELSTFAVLPTAEAFCRQTSADLGINTLESLIIGCIPQVSNVLKNELASKFPSGQIPQGDLTEESKAWIARSEAEVKARDAAAAAAQTAQAASASASASASAAAEAPPSNTYEIQIVANEKPYSVVVDLTTFTVVGTAEAFCRQKASELGIETMEMLVLRCIPGVADIVGKEIAKKYDPSQFAAGSLSPESAAWLENAQKEALKQTQSEQAQEKSSAEVSQAGETVQTAQAATPPSEFEVTFTANEKPYSITLDLTSFTVMSSAEAFCRQVASEIGISTMEALVTSCIPAVADVIADNLSKTFDPKSIPVGEMSADSRAWLAQNKPIYEQKEPVAEPEVFRFPMTIDGKEFTIEYNMGFSSPRELAERVCDSRELGLTSIKTLLYDCLPQVSEFVKKEVDSRIAPRSVSLGEHSNAVTKLFEADEIAAKLKASGLGK